MRSGRTLWDEMTFRYCRGVQTVRAMKQAWQRLERVVDADRFAETRAFLGIQEKEAKWWRDASVLYFQTFAKRPIADMCGAPERTLDEYISIDLRYVPGQ
jgi:alpha-glucuronidase